MLRPLPIPPLAAVAVLTLTIACQKGPAFGSENAVIAVIDPELGPEVEARVREAFEREVYTTRPERVFEVTRSDPATIGDFRKWERLIVIEALPDAELVPELVGDEEGPVFARVEDEWARGQTIWVLAAQGPEATAQLVAARIDSVYRDLHERWVDHQMDRMWASGEDTGTAERMQAELGFSLVIPNVYRSASADAPPDTRTWYNEDPRRVLSVHWRPPGGPISTETVLAARREWGRALFAGDEIDGGLPGDPPATSGSDTLGASDTASTDRGADADTAAAAAAAAAAPPVQASSTTLNGIPAIRLQGTWSNRTDRTGGLFLTYGVACGDRLVLLDGNLYAPERGKYPYLLQFERIFESFRCGTGP